MPRSRDRRLARLAARHVAAETEIDHWRATLEARLALCAVLRDMLAELGIDPARVRMLQVCDKAEAELAAGPPAAPVHPETAPTSEFEQQVETLARRYRANPEIDFSHASLISVFAWCVARLGADAPQFLTAATPLQKQR